MWDIWARPLMDKLCKAGIYVIVLELFVIYHTCTENI